MTKLEKMARDWDSKWRLAEVDHDDTHIPYPGDLGASYIAGFLAAREMALELEDAYAGQFRLRAHLLVMGEKEV